MFCCDCMRAGLKKAGGPEGRSRFFLAVPSLRNCVLALHNPPSLNPAFAMTACVPGLKKAGGPGGRSPPILLRFKVAVFLHFSPQTISCGFFFCVLFADEIESC